MAMSKKKLSELIERAMRVEEEAVPAIAQHIIAAIHFVERDEKVKGRIITTMEKLVRESELHARMLDRVISILEGENIDVHKK